MFRFSPGDQRGQFAIHVLPPDRPELGGGAGRGVLGLVFRQGQQQLRVEEQLGDFVVPLVAQVLADRLGDGVFDIGPFALDDRQGNTVDEQHDVGPPGLVAGGSFDLEFLGDVEDVGGQPSVRVPVDVVERKALGVAADRLLQALAENQQVVDLLVGADESVVQHVFQNLHGGLDVGLAELVLLPLEANPVQFAQLFDEHRFEQHVARLSPPQRDRLARREVAPAQILQELQGRYLRDVVFEEGREIVVHVKPPCTQIQHPPCLNAVP